MFNKIDGDFDEVAIKTFNVSLPVEHGLRKSLTGKLVTSLRQLMDRVDKYKRIEDDQQQGKGKAKVIPQEMRDFKSNRYNNNRPRRDYAGQSGSIDIQAVNTVFREPIRQVLEKIKNKPFFKWPIKWLETLRSAIKTSTTITIRNRDILRRTAEIYGITWISLSEKAS